MIPKLEDYRDIIGNGIIDKIREGDAPLSEKHIEHINSTFEGGGVAEILNTLVLLMNDVGIKTGWRLFKGHQRFFNITKSFHNALQGGLLELTDDIKNKEDFDKIKNAMQELKAQDSGMSNVEDSDLWEIEPETKKLKIRKMPRNILDMLKQKQIVLDYYKLI